MKYFLTLVVFLVAATLLFANTYVWFDGSLEEAKAKAQAEDKLIIVDFFSQF